MAIGGSRHALPSALVVSLLGMLAVAVSTSPAPAAKTEAAKPLAKKVASFGFPQVALINEQIRLGWQSDPTHTLTPSAPATDGEWCRRVFLDVLGRIPTVDELNRFLTDTAADKKLRLVNQLLGDEYIEDYARNWTSIWTTILVGRAGGADEDRMTNRAGLQQSLRRAFQRNIPYNKLASEIVSATGSSKPGAENFNGLVNFFANKLGEDGVQATAKTSQIFLGLQVQCTQCHNHPFNDSYKQNQFWELNAFFRQTRALRRYEGGRRIAAVELANQDFAGENKNPEEAGLFYELRNGKLAIAQPVFVDGTKLKSNSGYLDQVDRRTELARLISNSDYLGKAIVNRMWAHFFGYGFTKPIDDMGSHNPATHPELLDGLAAELKTHSFDLKQLIRWITLSEAYGLSSRYGPRNKRDDPSIGEKPMFSHFYLRQMRAEELYESLLVATEAHKTRGGYEEQEAAKRQWLSQFVISFGTDDNGETTTFNGTVPQVLMMMNGELTNQATSGSEGSFLHRIAMDDNLNNAAKIQYLYMAALARKPVKSETALANQLLVARRGNAVAALQDVWWALLNCNEFILNH